MSSSELAEKPAEAGHSAKTSTHGDSGTDEINGNGKEKAGPKMDAEALNKADSQVVQAPQKTTDDDLFKHLPPNEAEILRRQVVTPTVKAGVASIYRHADRYDVLIMLVSALSAIASGAALPLMTVVFGNLQGTFQNYFLGLTPYDDFVDEMTRLVLYFVYLGIGEFVTVYIATVGFIYTGEHISGRIRERYLESCMRQNIGFFDKLGAGEVTTRITADANLIQDGISEKVALTLSAVSTFISAFVIGESNPQPHRHYPRVMV